MAGVLDSADSATLTVTNSAGTAVVSAVPVAATSEGVYTYETTYLTPGIYEAVWTFVVSGQPDDVVSRTFQADGPVQLVTGVKLMDIEERVARRIGPYFKYKADNTSTVNNLKVLRLVSSLDVGAPEDLYILRRGIYWDGSQVEDFTEDDRQRQVSEYNSATGILTPDSPWTLAPQANERIEFHYLDPEQELRPAVLEGLERCYFWDRLLLQLTGGFQELNITSSFPWMRELPLLAGVELAIPGSQIPPNSIGWFRPYFREGSVFMHTDYLGPGDLYVDTLRPHSSYVNGEMSQAGPDDDFDILSVSLEYAARAGHVHCWINYPDRLTPAAANGLRMTSKMAADAFTQRSMNVLNQMPEFIRAPRWNDEFILSQVGNAWGAS